MRSENAFYPEKIIKKSRFKPTYFFEIHVLESVFPSLCLEILRKTAPAPPPHITEYMGISIERNFEKDLSLKSHERERNGTYTLHLNPFFVRVNFNFQAKLFLKIKDVITINSTIRIYGNRFLKGQQSYRNTLYCRFYSVSRYELSPGREFHCVFSLVSMHLHSASDKPLIFISKIQSFKSVPNNKTEEEVCCL